MKTYIYKIKILCKINLILKVILMMIKYKYLKVFILKNV